jgi:hypothetical protein
MLGVVARPEVLGYLGDGGPQSPVFLRFSKVHAGPPGGSLM